MKHYSEKDLINFANKTLEKEEMLSIEEHLKECFKCSMTYNCLTVKSDFKAHIKHEQLKAKEISTTCISKDKLKSYLTGKISKDEKQKIETHLYCCKECAEILLNIDLVNAPSLWQSIENTISEVTDWLKGIYFIPVGLDPVMSTKIPVKETQGIIKVYNGDELNIEIPVEKDGYLTVLHWNGDDISLIFPDPDNSKTFIKSGQTKTIEHTVTLPSGLQQIKTFITEKQLIKPEEIDFNDKKSIYEKLQEFIKKLQESSEDKWSQQVINYEVRELDI